MLQSNSLSLKCEFRHLLDRIFLTGDILPYLGIVHVDAVRLPLDLLNLNPHSSLPLWEVGVGHQCLPRREIMIPAGGILISLLQHFTVHPSMLEVLRKLLDIGPLYKCISERNLKVHHLRVFC